MAGTWGQCVIVPVHVGQLALIEKRQKLYRDTQAQPLWGVRKLVINPVNTEDINRFQNNATVTSRFTVSRVGVGCAHLPTKISPISAGLPYSTTYIRTMFRADLSTGLPLNPFIFNSYPRLLLSRACSLAQLPTDFANNTDNPVSFSSDLSLMRLSAEPVYSSSRIMLNLSLTNPAFCF